MRGKLNGAVDSDLKVRNIPAYAGKTMAPFEEQEMEVGTSPRMRGKQECLSEQIRWRRNIPAYAGKTT